MKKEIFKVVKAIPILVGFLFFDLPNAYSGEYHTNQGQPDCLDIAGQNPKEVLDEIMAESTQNAQVQSFINLIEASKYVLQSTKQYYVPQVIVGGSYAYYNVTDNTRLLEGQEYFVGKSYPNYLESTPYITINQNLFNPSQQSLISSNYFQVSAQRYQAVEQAQANAISASQLYNSIIQNYNTVLAIQKLVEAYTQQYENTFSLRKAGEASLIDLLSAKAQLQLYQQELLQTQTLIETAVANLETLLNRRICKLNSSSFLSFPTLDKLPSVSESAELDAINLSPTVNNFKAISDSAESLAQSYRLSYLPNLSAQLGMTGTYQFGNITGAGPASNEYDLSTSPFVQLSVKWMIFDGGTNLSLAKAQIETSKSNQKLIQQTSVQIQNSIQNFYRNDILNISSLEKATSQLKINEKLINLVSIGYRAGYLTYLNFQVQASTLYTSYLNFFGIEASLLNNRLQYYSLFLFRGFDKTYKSLQEIQSLSR
ncbi:MAG: TolC family protein [Cyanobacteriota bacterium]|jgi:outer membrane protein TolC